MVGSAAFWRWRASSRRWHWRRLIEFITINRGITQFRLQSDQFPGAVADKTCRTEQIRGTLRLLICIGWKRLHHVRSLLAKHLDGFLGKVFFGGRVGAKKRMVTPFVVIPACEERDVGFIAFGINVDGAFRKEVAIDIRAEAEC